MKIYLYPGDIVQISEGSFQGKTGVVKKIHNTEIDVRFAQSSSRVIVMSFDQTNLSAVGED